VREAARATATTATASKEPSTTTRSAGATRGIGTPLVVRRHGVVAVTARSADTSGTREYGATAITSGAARAGPCGRTAVAGAAAVARISDDRSTAIAAAATGRGASVTEGTAARAASTAAAGDGRAAVTGGAPGRIAA
jgi:hypothetical protein